MEMNTQTFEPANEKIIKGKGQKRNLEVTYNMQEKKKEALGTLDGPVSKFILDKHLI